MTDPPPTLVRQVVEVLHGVEVTDPYRWLEDEESAEVRGWLSAQGAYARGALDALPGRAALGARLAQALDCGALGAVVPRGRWRFLARRSSGMDQAALYAMGPGGEERVLVDPGPLCDDGTVALDWWYPSRDGEMVCFGLSTRGDEDSGLRLLRTATGAWLDDEIPHCRLAAVAFEPGGAAILYTRYPAPGTVAAGEEQYHRHVFRHLLGADPAGDEEVFGAGRDRLDYPVGISFSSTGRWCAIEVARGWEQSSVFLRQGGGPFAPIFEVASTELHAWFAGDRLLGLTNLDAPRYRLVEIDPDHPEPGAWQELVPESAHVLVGARATTDRLVVHHLVDACSRLTLHQPDGTLERQVDVPPMCTVTGIGAHWALAELYLTVETFTRPARAFQEATRAEVARLEPPDGFEADRYPVRQAWFGSRDGTRVPMFLVGREQGSGPVVLTGYGGFNLCRTPLWAATAVPFLEAGGLLTFVNLRGGGEFGAAWHRSGMLEGKQSVFDDFIAAAEWLIGAGLTTPDQLGIVGGSNGGLLVGAAMTQRPDLFGAVVCRVPLLDMVRYERFKVARLWAAEYGTASDPEQFGWLLGYSPYHHVAEGVRYPPALITTGEVDSRVDPMHARKMTARLQNADGGPVLLRVDERAGHGQGKPASKQLAEETDVWSFLMTHLGQRRCAGC